MSEKSAPPALALSVLHRLESAGVLKSVVLIGSWCAYFYQDYFADKDYKPSIRTRDIDFLVSTPPKIKLSVDVPALLEDMGFLTQFVDDGHMRLVHPDLLIEFLVPEKGRGTTKPYPIKSLNVNAQALRYLNFLLDDKVQVKVDGLNVILPHPANFALHKLIISARRTTNDKAAKDVEQAMEILRILVKNDRADEVSHIFSKLPPGWKKEIRKALRKSEGDFLLELDFLRS